jgi:hypothetical protein
MRKLLEKPELKLDEEVVVTSVVLIQKRIERTIKTNWLNFSCGTSKKNAAWEIGVV